MPEYDPERLLYAEQVKQLYEQSSIATIAVIANALILISVLWGVIPQPVLLGWGGAAIMISLVRYYMVILYRRHGIAPEDADRWWRWFLVCLTASGIIWGAAGFLLFANDSIVHQVFLFFSLGSMVAGGVAVFSAIMPAFFAYSVPALGPILIRFFQYGDSIHVTIGLVILIFGLLMYISAQRVHLTTRLALTLKFKNTRLIRGLEEEKERAEHYNEELTREISQRKRAEAELRAHRSELEQKVKAATEDLKRSNMDLQQEIVERQKTETALKESEEKYRLLVENATDGIFILQDGEVKFYNRRLADFFDYPRNNRSKISLFDRIHPDDRKLVLERYRKRQGGEDVPPRYSFRVNRKDKDVWVELNAAIIPWKGAPATLCFVRDMSRHKKLETQFRQAQKMESIGTLAGGVAHDFNNLLMSMQGNVSLVLMSLDSSHPHYRRMKNIEEYIQSGAELTRQLLGFAMSGQYEVKAVDLNQLIEKTLRMFSRTKKEIRVHTNFTAGLWASEVDPGQIEQVLMNLFVNSWQAMPGGGDLHIATENVNLNSKDVVPFKVEVGRYVKLSITDTGIGMDPEVQQRIFDPFYTTKEMGRGTGLGLASAYGIVKSHGGIINVYSEKGKGATFNIYLPASDKAVVKDKEDTDEPKAGTETVLLVDDERMIVEVGAEILETLGYTVILANGGAEAVEHFRKYRDDIDAVILDMVMPDMGGGQTFDRLKAIDPDVKVLLSSGYSLNGHANEILERGCSGFIQKPFNVKQLSHKLREILDSDKPAEDEVN